MPSIRLSSLALTIFYLAGPLLVICELFNRAISFPVLFLFLFYLLRPPASFRADAMAAKRKSWINFTLGIAALLLCVAWIYYSGIGGFALCRWDYVKHNLLFSHLLLDTLPIYTTNSTEPFILHYSFAYYITPVRLFQLITILLPSIDLDDVLLGVYSIASFLSLNVLACRRVSFFFVLFCVCLTGGLDVVGMLAFGVKPIGGAFPVNLEWWGVPYAPQSLTMNLYYAPQHFFGALIGTALLSASLQSDRPAAVTVIEVLILIAASVFWSAYVAMGLAVLACILAFTLNNGGTLAQRIRQERLTISPRSLSVYTFAIVLTLCAWLFLWASAPLSPPRIVVDQEKLFHWLLTYALNYAPALMALTLLSFTSTRREVTAIDIAEKSGCSAVTKMLAACLAASAVILVFGHGFYNDWAMRVTIPLSIFLAVLLTDVILNGLRWPYSVVLVVALVISSAASVMELTTSMLRSPNCEPYGKYSLKDMGELAVQYRGREDSILYRYLARTRENY